MFTEVDLHIHSKASDGEDEIQTLLMKIQNQGISTFALTDHDTVEGVLRMKEIVPASMQFISGIELTCSTKAGKCHILGYGYDTNNEAFKKYVAEASKIVSNKMNLRLNYLNKKFGFVFTKEEIEELNKIKGRTKPALAELIIIKLAKLGKSPKEINIYDTFLKDLPSATVNAVQAVKEIKLAGGIAVWAHPFRESGEKKLSEEQFCKQLEVLCSAGIDGLECYYSDYTKTEILKLCSIAHEKGLCISGGSDYHGLNKKNIHIGKLNKSDEPVKKETLTILQLFK